MNLKELKTWLDNHPLLKYWDPVYLVMLVIIFFSLIPQPFTAVGVEQGDSLNFNFLHIAAYFTLSFLLGIALRHSKKTSFKKYHYLLAILLSFTFSAAVEFLQAFVPGRSADFQDLLFNISGIVTAQVLRYFLKKEKRLLHKIF